MTVPLAMIDDKYEVYRIVTDLEGLHEAFRDRVEDLQVTREAVDDAGKFTARYSAKLLCVPPMKFLGLKSLPKMLKSTGMALVLVIDDERFAPVKAEMATRKRAVRSNVGRAKPTWLFTPRKASKISKNRWANVPIEMRKKLMKKLTKARYGRRRKSVVAPEIGAAR